MKKEEEKIEEQSKELPQEKKKTIDKKIIIGLIAILLLIPLVMVINNYRNKAKPEEYQEKNKETQENTNQEKNKETQESANQEEPKQETEKKATGQVKPIIALRRIGNAALNDSGELFLLDANNNILWKKVVNNQSNYSTHMSTDDNYLYYVDNNVLNKVDTDTKGVTVYNDVELKEDDLFVVKDNQLFVYHKYASTARIINLATNPKERRENTFHCFSNLASPVFENIFLLGDKVYCSNDGYIAEHDIKSGSTNKLDSNVTAIIDASSNWLLYQKKNAEKREYYMYNVYSKEKYQLPIYDYNYYAMKLFENNVYYLKNNDNIIYRFDGKEEKEYYKYPLKEKHEIGSFELLPYSRILLDDNDSSNCSPTAQACDGDGVRYIINVEKNEIQPVSNTPFEYYIDASYFVSFGTIFRMKYFYE